MATTRNRKTSGKAARKTARKAPARPRVARSTKKAAKAVKKAAPKKTAKTIRVKGVVPAAKSSGRVAGAVKTAGAAATARTSETASKSPVSRPASVKSAARAVAAARAGAAKRRAPSYIPRSRFNDDWMLSGPVELPRQPNPAAHAPTRKPPKPRAPKPKAISHEQAVANLKALLESRKRKDRGTTMAKGA